MRYLKDVIKELPTNCLFDKGKIGCGGTSLAIESDRPYVIAVPYSSLVSNKVAQYPNSRYPNPIFGVMEGISVTDVIEYLGSVSVPKIITTYDSLPKVVDALEDKVSEVNLLIDEYHLLFTQYGFRKQAITSVLDLYGKFKSYTFMTATPLEQDFILDELKHLPIVVQDWSDSEILKVTVHALRCNDVISSADKLIRRFLSGLVFGNLYLFVNSVSIINKLAKLSGLTPENCRVVYSKQNDAIVSYKKDGSKVIIPNSTVEDSPKKINLLTSTVFEGCDIFDREGKTAILSDPYHKNTMLDVSTSINQIAGRIRNSRYNGEITHLYKESKYRELSYDEFKYYIQEQTEIGERVVSFYESITDESVKAILTTDNSRYVHKVGNKLVFDKNLPKIDLFNYKVENEYTSTIALGEEYAYQNASFVSGKDNSFCIDPYRLSEGAGIDKTFKEIVQEISKESGLTRSRLIKDAETYYPFLGEAITKLGFKRIDSLGYVQKSIKDELLRLEDSSSEAKVFKKLSYEVGKFYSNSTIKMDLKNAYVSLGYSQRTAKATDLVKYYDIKFHRKRISGKQVEGYLILAPRY